MKTSSFILIPLTVAINPCERSACKNNGTCTPESPVTYTCQCGEWFSGHFCEGN